MNRVLRGVPIVPTSRPLRTGEPARDPAQEAAAAYERGVADGVAQERSEGLALAAAFRQALGDAAATRRAEAQEQAAALLRTALELAERIVGHAPHDDGAALETRVRAALAEVDDEPLELAVHPVDAARLGAVTATDPRLELTTDPSLRPGEAKLRGRWAEADLTRAAAVAAATSALP